MLHANTLVQFDIGKTDSLSFEFAYHKKKSSIFKIVMAKDFRKNRYLIRKGNSKYICEGNGNFKATQK